MNADLVPDVPDYYECKNSAGWSYLAIVTADGRLKSLDGPIQVHRAE